MKTYVTYVDKTAEPHLHVAREEETKTLYLSLTDVARSRGLEEKETLAEFYKWLEPEPKGPQLHELKIEGAIYLKVLLVGEYLIAMRK